VFLESVEPQNQSQTWVDHLPRKNGKRREFDLDLKFRQRWFKKIKKIENMRMESCYVIYYLGKILNMAYQDFIKKLYTKNATKQEFNWLSTHVTMIFETSIANF
jgi:hypothetical protein